MLVGGLWVFLGGKVGREVLDLAEGRTESGVLDAELVDEGPTFFPATVCLVCRGEGCIEEGGTGLEGLDVPGGRGVRRRI